MLMKVDRTGPVKDFQMLIEEVQANWKNNSQNNLFQL